MPSMLITDIFYHKKYLVIEREIPKINTVCCLLQFMETDHLLMDRSPGRCRHVNALKEELSQDEKERY